MRSVGIDIGGSSVKVAVFEGGRMVASGHSPRYARPGAEEVALAVAAALPLGEPGGIDGVGLCVPGVVDAASRRLVASVNMPGLVGADLGALVARATGAAAAPRIVSDARAAAHDYWCSSAERGRPLPGRLLAISLGTGVGACVLDEGRPLAVTGASSGHLGQIDVSVHEPGRAVPIGPDGMAGSVEAYIGLPALAARYGPDVRAALAGIGVREAPIRALVRCIRVAVAIYRPDHVALLGGVGLALGNLTPAIYDRCCEDLTALARPGWTLSAGHTDLHAAIGAARLAAEPAA